MQLPRPLPREVSNELIGTMSPATRARFVGALSQ